VDKNAELKERYDTMHSQGKSAWFDSGWEERKALLDMGQPWTDKAVLEIGCGEGDLLDMVRSAGGRAHGIDYSKRALLTLLKNYPEGICVECGDWRDRKFTHRFDVILMQGVMEHLDEPFAELAEMITRFQPHTVVMSMPGFLNTRGIVWHTLDMLGAVMSKTDLHFIDPWQVRSFCTDHGYEFKYESIDLDWGHGQKMLDDFRQRIPLALRDGNIPVDQDKLDQWFAWLEYLSMHTPPLCGAVNIYRIDL